MSEAVKENQFGDVVHLVDPRPGDNPFRKAGATNIQIAEDYIQRNQENLKLTKSLLPSKFDRRADKPPTEPVLVFHQEKKAGGVSVVVYEQDFLGLRIFGARLGVQINDARREVLSVQSSLHAAIEVRNVEQLREVDQRPGKLTKATLEKRIGLKVAKFESGATVGQVIYRFDPAARVEKLDHAQGDGGCFGGGHSPVPELPSISKKIEPGAHYIVDELRWSGALDKGQPPVNWRVLVEPKSGEVLYIRALVAGVTGLVYEKDPQTQTGDVVLASASTATLDSYRNSETLDGLVVSDPQELVGEFVEVVELASPVVASPTVPLVPGEFSFSADTDEFSAVNAYFHVDRCFRTMQDYGYNVTNYFGGTTFPVPVDHRGFSGGVNASCPGNSAGDGIGMMRFGLVSGGDPLGIATSNRVVWHEFGHGVLWDNVSSPNFGFAHSAGDSMAAILNDPESNELDRFDTFPYVQDSTNIFRRHDRDVAAGWGWFGSQYDTQYQGEQILSTTLFRLYRSLGGDSVHLSTRRRAAETTVNLIFGATGQLTATTTFPEVFVTNMQNTDLTTTDFKGVPGGAMHKVVRWAFEKQGLFQPDAVPGTPTPVTTEGNPPDVDVFINDGRNGEYEYQANHWSCQDMWVRRAPDGGLSHEDPIVGVPNYMYVRVSNRGLMSANNVRVDAYSCLPGTGLVFPDHWTAMTTPTLPAAGPIAPGGTEVLGPFEFTPTQVGHECLLAIAHADGDPGNDTTLTGSIDHARFVPFDNNVGQRNVNPVPALTGGLLEALRNHVFWVRNPRHEASIVELEVQLPAILKELGWRVDVKSQGGRKFEMSGRQELKVGLDVRPGKELDRQMLLRAIERGDSTIHVVALVNGEIAGGMSYPLAAKEAEDREPGGGKGDGKRPGSVATDVLDVFERAPLSLDRMLTRRGVRSITFDLMDE